MRHSEGQGGQIAALAGKANGRLFTRPLRGDAKRFNSVV